MAGDWIKMRSGLCDEPEVIALAACTGLDEDAVVGKLHRLWAWADQKCADGNAPGVTTSWIDRYVRADGFAAALVEVGWLESTESGVRFPKWERHMSKNAKRRALTATRAANHRTKRNAESNARSNAPRVTKGAPREEKRREESPPPTPSGNGPLTGGPGLEEVEEGLRRCGVSVAGRAARETPLQPEECLALIEEFESAPAGAWAPGALYRRVMGQLDEWPPKNHVPESDVDRAAREQREENLRQLEAEWGHAHDALPRDARSEIVAVAKRSDPEAKSGSRLRSACLRVLAADPDHWKKPVEVA
ncbi:hypothetical protein KOR34_52300 [Posidoniimonas corsicana]|uniref:Uncharacterized protein n=1 Tax=Posidoniimonas corsicana TaxID=1938618 RepID=A0A5C5UUU5_9BACT|nr:hypothetical protein [Posidoniimonas corsicana]TWT29320.1 hypothetical protein KOR34_52300 [Posidoniimonas corsicana]